MSKTSREVALAVALTVLSGGTVHAADHQILGRKLDIKNFTGDESARSVKVLGRERSTDVGNLVGNPVISGATLRIIANGGTDSDQLYLLDANGWSGNATGFKYRGPTGADGDPIRRVLLRSSAGRSAALTVIGRGNIGSQPLEVVPPNPGDDGGVILHINGGDTYCVSFGGAAGGIERDDSASRWSVVKATGQPGCPASPFATRCCEAQSTSGGYCFDASTGDALLKCALLGGTPAPGGEVCNASSGQCGAIKVSGVCCECAVSSPPFPDAQRCFDTLDGTVIFDCLNDGCSVSALPCGVSTETCGGSPSGAFVDATGPVL